MDSCLADQVRAIALEKYIEPAKKSGVTEFSIAVKDLLRDLEAINFPHNYTPLVCNSIKTKSFQRENHLKITRIEGPKSQTCTRVVVHYRVAEKGATRNEDQQVESPADRAKRLTEALCGLLKNEVAAHGGAEGFIRWVRSDEEAA